MVDLPEVPHRLALTEAPRNGISGADIAAPYAMFARAMDNLADAVTPAAIAEAEARGAEAVTIGPDGTPQLTEMSTLGILGQAYRRGAEAHYFAQVQTNAAAKYQEMRQAYQDDPARFNKIAEEYNRNLVLGAPAPSRPALRVALDKLRTGHYMDMSEKAFAVAQQGAKTALETQLTTVEDNLVALARKGGTQSGEYLGRVEDAKAILGELGRNPRWGYGPTVVEDKLRRLEDRGRAAAVLATVDATYDRVGPQEALRQAEAAIFDPDLRMDEAERQSRFNLVRAHIGARKAEATEDIREIRVLAEPTIAALRDGVDLEADGDLLRQRLLSLGDAIGAARITHAIEFGRGKRGQLSLPTRLWQGSDGEGATTGPVAQKVAAAATTAGLPLNIVMPVIAQESGFDPARRPIGPDGKPLSSAYGVFQLQKAEREAAGIGDAPDVEAQIPVGIAKMKSVYATTKAALGREPTAGEFYVVYYQGEGAGPKILANPAGDFAATVGERVLTANPWLRGLKTNADFIAWSERKMGERGAAGASAIASASQIAGYKSYAATTFDSLVADASKTIGKWHFDDDGIAFLAGSLLPFLDEKRRQKAIEFIGDAERAGALLDLSPDARQVLRNSMEEAAADGSRSARVALLGDEERFAALQRMEQETPLLRGTRAGWIKPPPPVPWQDSDENVAAVLQARGKAAMVVTSQLRRPVPAFEGEDLRALTNALDAADTSGKVRILGALATLPAGVREATFATLHDTGAKGAVLAFAGGLAVTAPEVATGIVRGREALVVEPRFAPEKDAEAQAFGEALDAALPATAFTVGARTRESGAYATIRAAVKARYADLSAAAGDTTGVLRGERLARAVDDVTGGTVRHNGTNIIAPRRGMDQRTFDGILLGLTDDDLAGARTTSGRAITAQFLRESATLESFADGRYLVRLNRNAEAPQYAITENGDPYILRLDDRQPAAPRAWGAPAPSAPVPWDQSRFGRDPSGWPWSGR